MEFLRIDVFGPGWFDGHESVGVMHTLLVHWPYRQSMLSTQLMVMAGAGKLLDTAADLSLRQGTLESPTIPGVRSKE